MMTIKQIAQMTYDQFELVERDDHTTFYRLKNHREISQDSPIKLMIYECHDNGNITANDYTYSMIVDSLSILNEINMDDDDLYEYMENYLPIYSSELLDYLNSNDRYELTGEYIKKNHKDFNESTDLTKIIQLVYLEEFEQVFNIVNSYIEKIYMSQSQSQSQKD